MDEKEEKENHTVWYVNRTAHRLSVSNVRVGGNSDPYRLPYTRLHYVRRGPSTRISLKICDSHGFLERSLMSLFLLSLFPGTQRPFPVFKISERILFRFLKCLRKLNINI